MTSAVKDGKTPAGILVRRVTFEYPDDLDAHWHPDMPEWSQVVNASSLLMPYLEPFLIQAVREALPRITDPALLEEAKGYIGQEAQHFRQHRRFNELIMTHGYGKLRAYERTLEADYEKIRAERDADFRLAYAAGFETMALAVGHMLVRFRSEFFKGADPAVTSLVLWHFVEELEHKHAAFDIYQHVVGSYRLRVKGLVFTMFHTLRRTRQAYKMLLIEDGRWAGLRTRWELKKLMVRIFGYLTPWILEAATPWHQPERFKDPDWVIDWIRLYDEGQGGLTELDTTRIDEMPSALVGAVTTIKVAAIQPQLRVGEVEWNLRRCEELVRKAAAETGADIIVLPEAVTSPSVYHPSLRAAPGPVDGPAYQLFRGLATELGCAVGAGYHSVRDGDAHHTYVLAEADGSTHLHDKDQPSVWENCYFVGGTDDGVFDTAFGRVGCAMGFECNRSRTARRFSEARVRLVVGGECLSSYPDWPVLKGYLRREQSYFFLWAADTTRTLARAVGAPAALAFHVGDVTMRTPLLPGVPWPTSQTGETQIVERDGRVLERMTAADGEGFVAATVTLADPEPVDQIPTGLWLRPQPFSIHAVWHVMNRHGRLRYRLDKALHRFPWQT